MIKNYDGKNTIYTSPFMEYRSRVFKMLPVVIICIFLLSAIIIIECNMPDPVPFIINQFLAREGYQLRNTYFERIRKKIGYAPDIYRSSKPIYYKNMHTEFWEVRCIAKLTKTYYIISPYYGEIQ